MNAARKHDGFWRPTLGRKRDITGRAHERPGITVYEIPVLRNLLRRGTLRVTLATYTNGDLSVRTEYVKKPWEEDEMARDARLRREYEARAAAAPGEPA
jgi:hypothetical protein